MNGVIRGFAMKQPAEFYNIVYDNKLTDLICSGLKTDKNWLEGEYYTIGFKSGNKLLGGLIYHNIRPKRDLWMTIYTTDKKWCNRRALKIIFGLAFNLWQVERISISVSINNKSCIKLVEKLGFKKEGLLRKYMDDGSDCLFYGMLKSENEWSK